MYSDPVFKQLVINYFYGQHGIASTMPSGFLIAFPAAALVLVRTFVSDYLFCFVTY